MAEPGRLTPRITTPKPRKAPPRVIPKLKQRFFVEYKPLRWTRSDWFKLSQLRSRFGPIWRKGPWQPWFGPTDLERRAAKGIVGSLAERIVHLELTRRKIPFDFQSSMFGGRLELGGMVADFILLDRPVVLRVQSSPWHTDAEAIMRDALHKAHIKNIGKETWDIWDWQVYNRDLFADWMRRHVGGGTK